MAEPAATGGEGRRLTLFIVVGIVVTFITLFFLFRACSIFGPISKKDYVVVYSYLDLAETAAIVKELKEKGMKKFLKNQEKIYGCPKCGDVVSVHNRKCYSCGNVLVSF